MTTVVAIGCSHTYGTMLDGIQSSSLFNLNNNYAALFAKKNILDLLILIFLLMVLIKMLILNLED